MPLNIPLVSTGLQVAGSIGSSLLNFFNQSDENQANRDFQHKEAELAYQRQVDLWNKQNAYNTPSAQMARYSAAGLNPNLIYSQQGVGASPVSAPQASSGASAAASVSNPFSNLFQNYMAVRSMQADEAVKESEIEANKGRSLLYDAQINNINSDTERKQFDLNFQKKVEQYKLELEALGVDQARATKIATIRAARKTELESSALAYQNDFAARTMESRIRGVDLGNMMLRYQMDYLKSQKHLSDEQKRNLEFINRVLEDEENFRRDYWPDGRITYKQDYMIGQSYRTRAGLPRGLLEGSNWKNTSEAQFLEGLNYANPLSLLLGLGIGNAAAAAKGVKKSSKFPYMYTAEGKPVYFD